MMPTLNPGTVGEVVLVEAVSVSRGQLERWAGLVVVTTTILHNYVRIYRNDIVVARQPDNPSSLICKRVSALVSECGV